MLSLKLNPPSGSAQVTVLLWVLGFCGIFSVFLIKILLDVFMYLLSLCLFLFNTTSPFSFAAHSHVSFMSFLSSNFLSFHHLFARISHEWFFYVSCCSLFYCWYIFSPSLSVPCCHYAGSGVSKSFYYLPLAFYGLLSPLQSVTHQSSAPSWCLFIMILQCLRWLVCHNTDSLWKSLSSCIAAM